MRRRTFLEDTGVVYITLTVTVNAGVKQINVTVNGTTTTYIKSTKVQVPMGATVSWTATADTGFEMDTSSGTISSMTSNQTISPTVVYNFVWDGQRTVNLGLPSGNIWQAFNLGASKPEEYGLYYQWGDTKGYSGACSEDESDGNNDKHYFDWSKYKWCNGSSSTLTKYCTNEKYPTIDLKEVLENEDDAAYVASGGQYRMPTPNEYGELFNTSYVSRYKAKCNEVKGYALVSKNDTSKAIFFPAAGYGSSSSMYYVGSSGSYWSSSIKTSDDIYAHNMSFELTSGYVNPQNYISRKVGLSVRGVVS